MAKNRIIYQTEGLLAGPAPATGTQYGTVTAAGQTTGFYKVKQLVRVQSINYGYSLNRRDVNQFGELAAIDRILLESPTVNLDFSYLNSSFSNEEALGFYINTGQGYVSSIANILNKTEDDRNYFIKTVPEGVDAAEYAGLSGANPEQYIAIGNGFISNFSTEASVGNFPTTSVSVEGLNILFTQKQSGAGFVAPATGGLLATGSWVPSPAVNPVDGSGLSTYVAIPPFKSNAINAKTFGTYGSGNIGVGDAAYAYNISALRPGDITFDFWDAGTTTSLNEAGLTISDAKIQSYNLSFSLSRDPLEKLGSKYAFAREIRFPVQVNLSVDANVGDLTTGNLVDVIQADKSYDIRIAIKHPQTGSLRALEYTLRNAKLDSQSFTSSIGPNKSVSLSFSSQIGGPLQTTKGLFFSGLAPSIDY